MPIKYKNIGHSINLKNFLANEKKTLLTILFLGWLPLATLMVFIFVYNLGYGAMVFITAVEILPTRVKEVGMR